MMQRGNVTIDLGPIFEVDNNHVTYQPSGNLRVGELETHHF